MNEITAEYMAGFFDGEGNVFMRDTLYKNGRTHISDRLRIANTDKDILDSIQKKFGGSVITKKIYNYSKKPQWEWCVNGRFGLPIARLLHPICIIKKIQLKKYIDRNKKNERVIL